MRLYIFSAILFLSACSSGGSSVANSSDVPDDRIPVQVLDVQMQSLALPVHGSGTLTSASEQRLAFKTGGIIRKIMVKEGDPVRQGQLLAVLDKTEIEAYVAQAEQGLSKAERDLSRVEGLYRDSSATLELFQNATTARDVAREQARVARFNRDYSEIRATRSGVVVKKLMNEGEVVGPGMPLLVVFETGPDDWVVKMNVTDRDWARVRQGQPANLYFDAWPDTHFSGKITDMPATADPSNGLYPIEVSVKTQGKNMLPGLFARVEIPAAHSREYFAVPVTAIVEGNGKSAFVYTLASDNTSVVKQPVQIALLEDKRALIASGLQSGQKVIVTGAPYLTERKKVVVQ